MTRPNESVHKLWEMPPIRFDQWRRENDLPELLGFFKTALPNFEEWQSVHKIDNAVFLTPTEPSKFFLGDKPAFLVSSTGPDEWGAERTTAYFHERRYDDKSDQEWQ